MDIKRFVELVRMTAAMLREEAEAETDLDMVQLYTSDAKDYENLAKFAETETDRVKITDRYWNLDTAAREKIYNVLDRFESAEFNDFIGMN